MVLNFSFLKTLPTEKNSHIGSDRRSLLLRLWQQPNRCSFGRRRRRRTGQCRCPKHPPSSKYLQILIVLDDEQLQGHPEPQLRYVHQYYHLDISRLCQRQTLKVCLCSLPEGEQVVGKTGSEILSSPVYLQNYICHKTYMTVQTTPKTTSRIFQIMSKCSVHELHRLTGTTRSGNQCLFLNDTPNIYHSLLP